MVCRNGKICNKSYKLEVRYKQHLAKEHPDGAPKEFVCPFVGGSGKNCTSRFGSYKGFLKHLLYRHNATPDPTFDCGYRVQSEADVQVRRRILEHSQLLNQTKSKSTTKNVKKSSTTTTVPLCSRPETSATAFVPVGDLLLRNTEQTPDWDALWPSTSSNCNLEFEPVITGKTMKLQLNYYILW